MRTLLTGCAFFCVALSALISAPALAQNQCGDRYFGKETAVSKAVDKSLREIQITSLLESREGQKIPMILMVENKKLNGLFDYIKEESLAKNNLILALHIYATYPVGDNTALFIKADLPFFKLVNSSKKVDNFELSLNPPKDKLSAEVHDILRVFPDLKSIDVIAAFKEDTKEELAIDIIQKSGASLINSLGDVMLIKASAESLNKLKSVEELELVYIQATAWSGI